MNRPAQNNSFLSQPRIPDRALLNGGLYLISERNTVRTIDKQTGEIFKIKPGGMYAPFPIPAYQVLIRKREHQAVRILTCLISHLGSNGWKVFPSYDTIVYEAGVSRNNIKKSLILLQDLGFIKISSWREGKKDRNCYFIQEAAYDSSLMKKYAKSYRPSEGACRRCGTSLDRGGFRQSGNGHVHLGCGGSVKVKGVASKKPYRHIVLVPRYKD